VSRGNAIKKPMRAYTNSLSFFLLIVTLPTDLDYNKFFFFSLIIIHLFSLCCRPKLRWCLITRNGLRLYCSSWMYCSLFVVIYLKLFLKLASSQCEITVIPLYAFHLQARFTLTLQNKTAPTRFVGRKNQGRNCAWGERKISPSRCRSFLFLFCFLLIQKKLSS
jgi:hypothetical protein